MRTLDDREQPIELLSLERALMKRPQYMPMKLTEPQRLRHDRMLRDGFILMLVPVIIALASAYITSNTIKTMPCIASIGSLVLIGLALRFCAARYERIDAIHWITAYKNCGACGHSLNGLNPQHDGCTVCPECGAAWLIPRD